MTYAEINPRMIQIYHRSLVCAVTNQCHVDADYERNFYSVPTTIVSETEFDMFRATFGDYSYKYQEPVTETHSDYYKVCVTRAYSLVRHNDSCGGCVLRCKQCKVAPGIISFKYSLQSLLHFLNVQINYK